MAPRYTIKIISSPTFFLLINLNNAEPFDVITGGPDVEYDKYVTLVC